MNLMMLMQKDERKLEEEWSGGERKAGKRTKDVA